MSSIIAVASYSRLKAYNDPPPRVKNSSPAVPKDKMRAAREIYAHKKPNASTAGLSQNSSSRDTMI